LNTPICDESDWLEHFKRDLDEGHGC
jgi:hypothetical protein